MSILIACAVVGILSIFVAVFAFSPLWVTVSYLFIRPLVQPFASLGYVVFGFFPITAIFPIMVVVIAYALFFIKKRYSLINKETLSLYLLIYFSTVSILETPSYFLSTGHMVKLFSALGLYILAYNAVKSDQDINRLLWGYLICTVIPMLFGYYQFITNTGHTWKGAYYAGRRIDSLLMEYNAYGEFLCISICAGIMIFFAQHLN